MYKKGFIGKLSHFLSPLDLDLQEKSKRILAGLIAIITVPVIFLFSLVHLLRDYLVLGFLLLLTAVSVAISFSILRNFEKVTTFSRLNIAFVGILFLYLLSISGPHGYLALWLYVYPLVVFFMLGRVEGLKYNSVFFIGALLILLFQDLIASSLNHEVGFKVRFLFSLFLVGVLAYTFEFVRDKFQRGMMLNQVRLEEEKEKLTRAEKIAIKANQAKSEFLANISHEFRTPLNHIIGFTELVLDSNLGKLNDIQKEYLGDVHSSGKHLLSLINDLLDLSKVESGRLKPDMTEVNLRELLEKSLAVVKDMAVKHGIQLSLTMASIPEIIKSDEKMLNQIMDNLLSNALKFNKDRGSVRVSAKMVECCTRPGLRSEDPLSFDVLLDPMSNAKDSGVAYKKCIEIAISDSGIGIQPEDRKRIFNRFEQVDSSAQKKYQGTGLGLALTKRLVELAGGKIWVASDGRDQGSTFRFIIPV